MKSNEIFKRKKTLNRILVSSGVLILLLTFHVFSMLIFITYPQSFDSVMHMIEILLHLLYLIFVLTFYNGYFKGKIANKIKQS